MTCCSSAPLPCTQTRRAVGRKLKREPRPRGSKTAQVDRDSSELTEIHVDALPDRRLCKRGNLRDCCRHAVALRTKALQRPAGGLGQIGPPFEQFDGTGDNQERIVDLVHDPRQQPRGGDGAA